MGIHYKFASAKEFSEISIDGSVISVAAFKRKVLESKYKSKKKSDFNGLCLGTDLDFIIVNAQTNEEYDDNSMTIANHASVLLRRVPGSRRRRPIAISFLEKQIPLSSSSGKTSATTNYNSTSSASGLSSAVSTVTSLSSTKSSQDSMFPCDDHQFGSDSSTIIPGLDGADDEDSNIKALVNTPALDWNSKGVKCGRSYGRMGFGLDKRTPHEGYVCRRCGVPGHFIHDCPTNGDPNYDFKRMKPAAVPLLPENEAAFDREMEFITSRKSLSASDVPPELLCPLCKQVIRDAALTGKCCFTSFCDRCIRDHLMLSQLKCVCGATQVLTDSLIPNITLRNTINRILEVGVPGNSGNAENSTPKNPSAAASASASELSEKGKKASPDYVQDMGNKRKLDDALPSVPKKAKITAVADVPMGATGSMRLEQPASQGSVQAAEEVQQVVVAAEEEGQQKVVAVEEKKQQKTAASGEMKRKKKQSKTCQDAGIVMPVASYDYNPYWYGVQAGMEGYIAPYYYYGGCNGMIYGSLGSSYGM